VRAELRTLQVLVGLPAFLLFAVSCCLILLQATGIRAFILVLPAALSACFILLAIRISRIAEAGFWRLLPHGQRAVMRAAALAVLALSIALGAALTWAPPQSMRYPPIWPVPTLFVQLSLLVLLLLPRAGQARWRPAQAMCLVLWMAWWVFSMKLLRDVAWLWLGGSAILAVVWLFACFDELPQVAGSGRHRPEPRPFAERVRAGLKRRIELGGSATRTVLRAPHAGGYLGLPLATLILTIWTVNQHEVVEGRSIDSYRTVFGSASWMLGVMTMAVAQRYLAPARWLWLRWGSSRRDIFTLVERNVILDAIVLGTFVCVASVFLAVLRGLPLHLVTARLLVFCWAIALASAYLGLMWSTCYTWWERAITIAPIAFLLIYPTRYWLMALGFRGHAILPIDAARLALLVLGVLALRVVAAWRWKSVDWAHFRTIPRSGVFRRT
jgi:hypothetical protein